MLGWNKMLDICIQNPSIAGKLQSCQITWKDLQNAGSMNLFKHLSQNASNKNILQNISQLFKANQMLRNYNKYNTVLGLWRINLFNLWQPFL